MCGINGWIDWEKDLTLQHHILEGMNETLSKRGPDAAGIWISARAALGHRRLIVVDPAGGTQPMVRRRGNYTYVISYNGELYNTQELRLDLQNRGYTFLTKNSDTETLLLAYMEWGPDCLKYLNGIFAFAVWNECEQSLFLARDRLGVKPLFYTQRDRAFLFGSEIKSLLAHPTVKAEVDGEGLAEIFAMCPARTPGHGVFRHIKELKPGHYLLYRQNGLRINCYWKPESETFSKGMEETATNIFQLLKDAVNRQLVSDVPVCVLLSGGLDSSAIAAFTAAGFKEKGLEPLNTYSVDYVDNEQHFQPSHFQPDSDAPWVEFVSGYLGTNHHKIIIGAPELAGALDASVAARDLPGMADIDSSLYLFCRQIKKDATVALSGEAADEIFGGYPWFNSPQALNEETFPWMRQVEERMQYLSPELVKEIQPKEYILTRYLETIKEVPRLPGEPPLEARRREMFYLNMTWFMATLLNRKDRMSMANGLEIRVPYCDHRLVEFAWNIPWEMKACNGQPKGILRKALTGVLPGEVLARRKSPYPKIHNPSYLGLVKNRLEEILLDKNSPIISLINVNGILSLLRSGKKVFHYPWFGQLMGDAQFFAHLIEINAWLQKYRVRTI